MSDRIPVKSSDTAVSPSLSIIMPTYNGADLVQEAVNSVLMQSFADWELIISDDGSTDGTRAYLDSLTDSRIRVYKQEKNQGIFGNLNFLFGQARAACSLILCQDDYLVPGGLDTLSHIWEDLPASVGFVRFNWDPNINKEYHLPTTIRSEDAACYFFVTANIAGNLSNVSVRTAVVTNVGGFRTDLPYAGDFEFWSRIAQQVDFGLSKEKVTVVRRHAKAASFTLNKRGELVNQLFTVVNNLYDVVQEQHPSWLNRLLANIGYDVFQRDAAMRSFLRTRDLAYLQQLSTARKKFHYSEPLRWFLYIITLGGRWLFITRRVVAGVLANKTGKHSPKEQPSTRTEPTLTKRGQYDV